MVNQMQFGAPYGYPAGWMQTAKSVPAQGVNQQANIYANRNQSQRPTPAPGGDGNFLQLFQMLISIMMQCLQMMMGGQNGGPQPLGQPGNRPGGQNADQGALPGGFPGGLPGGLPGINNNQNNAAYLDNSYNQGQNQNTGNFGNLFNMFGNANANANINGVPGGAALNNEPAQNYGNVVVADPNTPVNTYQSNYYVGADQTVNNQGNQTVPGGNPFINTNQNNATYLDNSNNNGSIQNTGNFGNMNFINNIYFGCHCPGHDSDQDVQPDYKPPVYEGGKSGRFWGDPHFEDPDGGKYDVQGEAGKNYNILSDQNLQFNAHFVAHGNGGATVVDEVGFMVGDNRIHYGLDGAPTVNNTPMVAGQAVDLGNNQSALWNNNKLTVNTTEYNIDVERHGTYMNANVGVTDAGPYSDYVATHGLLGQTFDNGVKNNGTGSQGQGAIEGTYQDYQVPDLFSDQFKYNRYGAQVGQMTGTDTNNDGVPDTLNQVLAADQTTVLYG